MSKCLNCGKRGENSAENGQRRPVHAPLSNCGLGSVVNLVNKKKDKGYCSNSMV